MTPQNACSIYDATSILQKSRPPAGAAYPIKSWKKILSIQSNETEIVNFIVSEWKKPQFTSRLGNKVMFVAQGSKCWKLTAACTSAVPEFDCNHEEADTHMVIHTKHANSPIVIHADDTDVMVLLICHSRLLGTTCMKTGRGSKARIIQLDKIKKASKRASKWNHGSRFLEVFMWCACINWVQFSVCIFWERER